MTLPHSAQWRTQKRMIEAGRCKQCGAARGQDGTTTLCGDCRKDYAAYQREYRARLKARKKCMSCQHPAPNGNYCERCQGLRRENQRRRAVAVATDKEAFGWD